jgi:hypothetical protein
MPADRLAIAIDYPQRIGPRSGVSQRLSHLRPLGSISSNNRAMFARCLLYPRKQTLSGANAEIGGGISKNILEWKRNNSIYRCDPQSKGVSLARSSLVEKTRSNLFLASA